MTTAHSSSNAALVTSPLLSSPQQSNNNNNNFHSINHTTTMMSPMPTTTMTTTPTDSYVDDSTVGDFEEDQRQQQDQELQNTSDKAPPKKPLSSNVQTFANIIKANIGSGILGMPFAFKNSGYILGTITLVLMAMLTIHSTILLIRCKNFLNSTRRRGLQRRNSDKNEESAASSRAEDLDVIGSSISSSVSSSGEQPNAAASNPQKSSSVNTAHPVTDESNRHDDDDDDSEEIITYGQVGKTVFGAPGDFIISCFLIFTQCGFCCAYLIFMGQNLSDMIGLKHLEWMYILIICIVLIPIAMVRSLKNLSPFSMISEVCLIVGLFILLFFDIKELVSSSQKGGFPGPTRNLKGFDWANFPVFFGITIFSFEGIGLALPIQHNMKKRESYDGLLIGALFLISCSMGIFGLLGYFAYGVGVQDVITLNLPNGSVFSYIVKIAFIIALLFTHPIQLFPVSELLDHNFRLVRRFVRRQYQKRQSSDDSIDSDVEEEQVDIDMPAVRITGNTGEDLDSISSSKHSELRKRLTIKHARFQFLNMCLSLRLHGENIIRIVVIIITGLLAAVIPDFGNFLSLVGGFGGTMLAFVLPSLIHLRLFWGEINWMIKLKDVAVIVFGVSASLFTAYLSIKDIIKSMQKH